MLKRTLFLSAIALTLLACSSSGEQEITPSSSSSGITAEFTFNDIQYWVGEGENRAMLIVQWNDGKKPDALAYGYRWATGQAKKGYDMVNDIAKADDRFFYLRFYSGDYLGYAIGGIGFDDSGNAKISNSGSCKPPVNGSIDTDGYDFDDWKLCAGASARWGAGWHEAYWSYWVADDVDGKWEYSGLGASSRVLADNSVDAWYLDLDMNDPDISTFHRCMAEPDNCDGRNFFGDIASVNVPR